MTLTATNSLTGSACFAAQWPYLFVQEALATIALLATMMPCLEDLVSNLNAWVAMIALLESLTTLKPTEIPRNHAFLWAAVYVDPIRLLKSQKIPKQLLLILREEEACCSALAASRVTIYTEKCKL